MPAPIWHPPARAVRRAVPADRYAVHLSVAVKVDEGAAGDYRARHLIRWYNRGADGKIPWGSPGDFDACVAVATEHAGDQMTPSEIKGFCANRHHDALGIWPATHAKELGKVGPKGYVHGWIHVGPTGAGSRVAHPELGHGTVTHHEDGRSHVHFDSGRGFQFQHSATAEATHGHFAEHVFDAEAKRAAPRPGELPRGAAHIGELLNHFAEREPTQEELDQAAAYLDRAAGLTDPHTMLKIEVQQVVNKPKAVKFEDGKLVTRWSVYDDGDHGKSYRPVVGLAQRTYSRNAAGGVDVSHDEFDLRRQVQGGGFAARWNHKAEAMYRANSVDRITLYADMDIGGYAWAKQGYAFQSLDEMRDVADRLERAHKATPGAVSDEEIQGLLNRVTPEHWVNGTAPSPVEWAMLGWTEGADTWLGKRALLGSAWHGVKEL